jgi:hypothetical protein
MKDSSVMRASRAMRSFHFPAFTEAYPLRQGGYDELNPANDAYSDFVTGLWQVDYLTTGYIQESHRNIDEEYWRWSIPEPWSEGQTEAGYPAMSRNAGVWRQEFTSGDGEIVCRFHGETHPTRLTTTPGVDHLYPQADVQLASARGGFDTLRVIWTEQLQPGQYTVCFASFLHRNADRDWFYNIVCGREDPSPYCVQRDGAMTLDAYSVDYADSALVYRLSYLNPLYRYRIRATVYQQSSAPVSEEFAFPVDSFLAIPGTVVTAEPGVPVEVWFDVPPKLHQDGVTDLVIHRLEGDYAVVAGLELHEFEPEDFSTASGGQSGGRATLRHPPAILGVLPNPFTRATTIRYQLFSPGPVLLRVLDVSGRCVRVVRTPESGLSRPGIYTAIWDGTDDHHRSLPNGIYFCRLEASGSHATAKVCLVR